MQIWSTNVLHKNVIFLTPLSFLELTSIRNMRPLLKYGGDYMQYNVSNQTQFTKYNFLVYDNNTPMNIVYKYNLFVYDNQTPRHLISLYYLELCCIPA